MRKTKILSFILSLCMVLASISLHFIAYADDNDIISDEILKAAINTKLARSENLPVSKLDLSRVEGIVLDAAKLKKVDEVDLSGIEFASNLKLIGINTTVTSSEETSNIKIKNLDKLKNLPKLETVKFQNIGLTSIPELPSTVTELFLPQNEIVTFDNLSALNAIETLDLTKNQIEDISFLQGYNTLTALYLSENKIQDISVLKNLSELQFINLSKNRINDIKALKALKQLQTLVLGENHISDFSHLKELENLQSLHAAGQVLEFAVSTNIIDNPLKNKDGNVIMIQETPFMRNEGVDKIRILDFDNIINGVETDTKFEDGEGAAAYKISGQMYITINNSNRYKLNVEENPDADITTTPSQEANVGVNVSVKVDITNASKELEKITVNGREIQNNRFVMPSEDVTIKAVLKDKVVSSGRGNSSNRGVSNISVPDTTNREIHIDNSVQHGKIEIDNKKAQPGQKITITPKADKGYVLKSIKIKDEKGNQISLTENKDKTYSFKMPKSKVTIVAEFAKEETKKNVSQNQGNETKQKVSLKIGSKTIVKTIDGKIVNVQAEVAPFIRQGRTMMPVRYVAETLGVKVNWDKNSRTVVMNDGERVIFIPIDTNKIIVDGKEYVSDIKPIVEKSRTYLPIGNIAKALGLVEGRDIIWDAQSKEVSIVLPER